MPFDKQAAGKGAILFSDDEHRVYAISKPERGPSYTLDQPKFEYLVTSVRYARVRLVETLSLLSKIGSMTADDVVAKGAGNERILSLLGLLADHFNLVKVQEWEGVSSEIGAWRYPFDFKCAAKPADLATLVNTVKAVFTATSEGLAEDQLFRGLAGENTDLEGKVVSRTNRAIGADVFFPEDSKWLAATSKAEARGKTLAPDKAQKILLKLPKLQDDEVFLKPAMRSKGFIHVNYLSLTPVTAGIAVELLGRVPMFWAIIHEATHKYARTRDVNHPQSYSAKDCRSMHWLHAIRNAQHYMRFAGMRWDEPPKKGQTRWNNLVKDMAAEPHH